jgi:hypothetical protein
VVVCCSTESRVTSRARRELEELLKSFRAGEASHGSGQALLLYSIQTTSLMVPIQSVTADVGHIVQALSFTNNMVNTAFLVCLQWQARTAVSGENLPIYRTVHQVCASSHEGIDAYLEKRRVTRFITKYLAAYNVHAHIWDDLPLASPRREMAYICINF